MSQNINNDETHRLAQAVAVLTGESMTIAVIAAVGEHLNHGRRIKDTSLGARLLVIGQDCTSYLSEPSRSVAHGDLLYDTEGSAL